MRVLRALFVALLTAFAGCILAFFIGNYLTRLVHVPEMEGQRGMTVLFLCAPLGILAALVGGVPYLLSNKPPKINGKHRELQFELRAPATFKIPEQPDGYSIRVSLYTGNRQSRFAFIDWNSIRKDAGQVTISGKVPLLTHSKTRSLLASIGTEPAASQFDELKNLQPAPRKQDEAWSDWIFATERADLTLIPDPERFAIRYRVHPIQR